MSRTNRMSTVRLRSLREEEGDVLVTATLGTMNWCGDRVTRDDVLQRPELAHYTRLLPERDDLGVVAECGGSDGREDGGRVLGVAWALRLPQDDPSYGFVDAATPELGLWVAAEARGQGLGRTLLRALLDAVAAQGAGRVSLSVEAGNTAAIRLYLSEGFEAVPGREADGVMVKTLDAA